jgi:hypothetical protein
MLYVSDLKIVASVFWSDTVQENSLYDHLAYDSLLTGRRVLALLVEHIVYILPASIYAQNGESALPTYRDV